jgi:hypothetical protein
MSRRWDTCHSARPSRDAGSARHGGSVAGVECKSGFRQTWGWLGERLRECACLVGVTSLRHYLITHVDGLPTAASVVLNEPLKRNDCGGSTVRRGGYFGGRANS